jgi:hypothetical protein
MSALEPLESDIHKLPVDMTEPRLETDPDDSLVREARDNVRVVQNTSNRDEKVRSVSVNIVLSK